MRKSEAMPRLIKLINYLDAINFYMLWIAEMYFRGTQKDLSASDQRISSELEGITDVRHSLSSSFSDNGTDEYDTSDKARIPAWTDRVLYKGQLKLSTYDRAELRTSDHRPVYAIFEAKVREVDEEKKDKITREILGNLEAGDGFSELEKRGMSALLDAKSTGELPHCISLKIVY